MTDRHARLDAFLDRAGWGMAERAPLAADASRRSYIRLTRPDGTRAMAMDAPPDAGEDVRPFVAMARHMRGLGLSVPEIRAEDVADGFLLLEDLGDDLLARHVAAHPGDEPALYAAAAAALAPLQDAPPPDTVADYAPLMPELAALAIDWYAPEAAAHRADLVDAMADALDALSGQPVLVHRDYHAENLLWLPERTGVARIGMLDFQDAMRGPAAYDLASLVHDPRRPVSGAARAAGIVAYAEATGAGDLSAALATCSAQRALRILGVFARLCLRDGKLRYLDFIMPTWAVLVRDLEHPALARLQRVAVHLPAPDPARLDALRAKAGTYAGRDRVPS
ncbi:phosphotransferase [uncultured Jannaschia sp.]|uniref:aminoglycoside phosphotransferase family protein n=1 Tax=uncultured Jannaschia sp. TaxID=293347 RepID=UPI002628ACB9|nr:phosphotransferase [uncultured Jannaschia sp.]